jgi:putative SOS response-associated peptidase YedK
MCGRYSLFVEQDEAELRQILNEIGVSYPDRSVRTGEIYPTDTAPVLSWQGCIHPQPAIWGFQKFQGKGVIINARAETAAEKPMFRHALLSRRCVVPSTGFYEWDRQKQKYLFRLPGEPVLYLAGFLREEAGEDRYVILTTSANDSMQATHNRMPVILRREQIPVWLTETDAALRHLKESMPSLARLRPEAERNPSEYGVGGDFYVNHT